MTVQLECASCHKKEEFPERLVVVDEELTGWQLTIESVENSKIVLGESYCLECS